MLIKFLQLTKQGRGAQFSEHVRVIVGSSAVGAMADVGTYLVFN